MTSEYLPECFNSVKEQFFLHVCAELIQEKIGQKKVRTFKNKKNGQEISGLTT